MTDKICHLFGAGEFDGTIYTDIQQDDYIIAVDGGYDHIKQIGITPNLLIGDFDSIKSSDNTASSCRILKFPPKKDYTDMHLGVLEGIKAGYNTFIIYGGTGGRIDHTIANIQLIAWLSAKGCTGYIIGGDQVITAITSSSFIINEQAYSDRCLSLFTPSEDRYISVFSHTDISEGVTIEGLEYNVSNVTLTNDYALGTSNSYAEKYYHISVEHGTLIITTGA